MHHCIFLVFIQFLFTSVVRALIYSVYVVHFVVLALVAVISVQLFLVGGVPVDRVSIATLLFVVR